MLFCHYSATVVIPGVIAQSEQDLHIGMIVLHVKLNWAPRQGEHGAVVADGVLAAAGEGGEAVFIEAAG